MTLGHFLPMVTLYSVICPDKFPLTSNGGRDYLVKTSRNTWELKCCPLGWSFQHKKCSCVRIPSFIGAYWPEESISQSQFPMVTTVDGGGHISKHLHQHTNRQTLSSIYPHNKHNTFQPVGFIKDVYQLNSNKKDKLTKAFRDKLRRTMIQRQSPSLKRKESRSSFADKNKFLNIRSPKRKDDSDRKLLLSSSQVDQWTPKNFQPVDTSQRLHEQVASTNVAESHSNIPFGGSNGIIDQRIVPRRPLWIDRTLGGGMNLHQINEQISSMSDAQIIADQINGENLRNSLAGDTVFRDDNSFANNRRNSINSINTNRHFGTSGNSNSRGEIVNSMSGETSVNRGSDQQNKDFTNSKSNGIHVRNNLGHSHNADNSLITTQNNINIGDVTGPHNPADVQSLSENIHFDSLILDRRGSSVIENRPTDNSGSLGGEGNGALSSSSITDLLLSSPPITNNGESQFHNTAGSENSISQRPDIPSFNTNFNFGNENSQGNSRGVFDSGLSENNSAATATLISQLRALALANSILNAGSSSSMNQIVDNKPTSVSDTASLPGKRASMMLPGETSIHSFTNGNVLSTKEIDSQNNQRPISMLDVDAFASSLTGSSSALDDSVINEPNTLNTAMLLADTTVVESPSSIPTRLVTETIVLDQGKTIDAKSNKTAVTGDLKSSLSETQISTSNAKDVVNMGTDTNQRPVPVGVSNGAISVKTTKASTGSLVTGADLRQSNDNVSMTKETLPSLKPWNASSVIEQKINQILTISAAETSRIKAIKENTSKKETAAATMRGGGRFVSQSGHELIPSIIPTSNTKLKPDVCLGCKMDGGLGYIRHPTRCDQFIVCYPDRSGLFKPRVQDCPYGQFWSNIDVTCRPSKDVNCENDFCKKQPENYQYSHSINCVAFWQCHAGHSVIRCCPKGMMFVKGEGCVYSTVCSDRCPVSGVSQFMWQANCDKRPVVSAVTMYEKQVASGWVSEKCDAGQIFKREICDCIPAAMGNPTYAFEGTCKPEVFLPFDTDFKDYSGSNTFVRTENVTLMNGAACFHGNSVIAMPKFANMDFGKTVFMKIRYKQGDLKVDTEALLYNGDCEEIPTLVVGTKPSGNSFSVKTNTGAFQTTWVPSSVRAQNWRDVTITISSGRLEGQSGINTGDIDVSGGIARSHCGIKIGWGKKFNNFVGCIDEVSIYRCIPNSNMSVDGTIL